MHKIMRLVDIVLDRVGESYIFEMARSRKEAKTLITGLSSPVVQHLIKLFVFNSPVNKAHWIKEINQWLNQIDDIYLKPSNKKPDWQTIYNWMVYDSSPHYSAEYIDGRVQKWLGGDYQGIQVYDYDAELVLNQILRILERVAKDISIPNKFRSITEYLD